MDEQRNKMLLEIKHKIKEYNALYKNQEEMFGLLLILKDEKKQAHNEMEISEMVFKANGNSLVTLKNRYKEIVTGEQNGS
jgi:hypothetical protein